MMKYYVVKGETTIAAYGQHDAGRAREAADRSGGRVVKRESRMVERFAGLTAHQQDAMNTLFALGGAVQLGPRLGEKRHKHVVCGHTLYRSSLAALARKGLVDWADDVVFVSVTLWRDMAREAVLDAQYSVRHSRRLLAEIATADLARIARITTLALDWGTRIRPEIQAPAV